MNHTTSRTVHNRDWFTPITLTTVTCITQLIIYFLSTKTFTGLKWGTPAPIMLRDPEFKQVRVKVQANPLDFKSVMVEIQAAVVFGEQILRFAPSFHLHPGQVELVVQPEAV